MCDEGFWNCVTLVFWLFNAFTGGFFIIAFIGLLLTPFCILYLVWQERCEDRAHEERRNEIRKCAMRHNCQ
jgi:hypothetical protein